MSLPTHFAALEKLHVELEPARIPGRVGVARVRGAVERTAEIQRLLATTELATERVNEAVQVTLRNVRQRLERGGTFRVEDTVYSTWRVVGPEPWILVVPVRGRVLYVSPYPNFTLVTPVSGTLTEQQCAYWDHHRFQEREWLLDIYRERAAREPDRARRHYELALVVWSLYDENQVTRATPGPLEEAEPPLRRAIEMEPDAADYRGLLGEVLSELGRHREAAACYRQAAELDGRNPWYPLLLAGALFWVGDDEGSRRHERLGRSLARRNGASFDLGAPRSEYRLHILQDAAARIRRRVERVGVVDY